ncbi:UbiA family prenyltransferase [Pseudomonas atagonensis]|uniref:UbiA family prenyltransferase n=1 Tax=Pseudomonas atagonensis TaxID=2609964 RepID=UPI001407C68E|nr:UbiA family prenyltransferase [Pseudomonas atagonensis]
MNNNVSSVPLCIDLDGTLIHSDMLHESVLGLVKAAPLSLFRLPFWLAKGKAEMKKQIAERTEFDPSSLPYNLDFVAWLREQHASGRRLILCTASDRSIANPIAQHLGFFDEVLASDGLVNLAGSNKAKALIARFGEQGFDYAGNSAADLKVWEHARRAIVVNASTALQADASACAEVEQVFAGMSSGATTWSKLLRVHQWLKNGLLAVPLFAAHGVAESGSWLALLLAFVAFSLCASSVYIANDLLDLESDRQHPRKSKRPFAAGLVPAWKGVLLGPVLLVVSLLIAAQVGPGFLAWLSVYFVLTCVYSFKLKQLVLIDCLTLAILYTLRIVAGAAAVGMVLSFWLLAFSVFLFLSLAFVKRFAELQMQLLHGKHKAHGRGYFTDDAPLIQMLGVASGFSSVLVLALYLNSVDVLRLYQHPEWVWGNVPVMLFWISWVWLRAHRGEMHDDPLVFAVKDKASLLAGVVFAMFIAIGAGGWV